MVRLDRVAPAIAVWLLLRLAVAEGQKPTFLLEALPPEQWGAMLADGQFPQRDGDRPRCTKSDDRSDIRPPRRAGS